MKTLSLIFSLLSLFLLPLESKEVIVQPSSGDCIVLDVEPVTPFFDVVEEIQGYLNEANHENYYADLNETNDLSFFYSVRFPGIFSTKGKPKNPRDYSQPATPAQKENIRFIIQSLAKHNWAQLAKEESTLKKVGDKIDRVHPFRFLQCVFTDEELKVGLYVIRRKNLVWGEYYDGLKKSLNDESDLNNLVQFTADFANNVGVNVHTILPYVQKRQWTNLIDVLLESIPRQGNPDRYNM